MNFPILTLESVREAIAGRTEFVEANRGDHIIFNYNVAFSDSFDCPIRRECRGLIFSPEGEILSRRFHKFFNMNEREETQSHLVITKMVEQNFWILEKLDGSMITPVRLGGKFRWCTKMGITDVAAHVENFIVSNRLTKYEAFAEYCENHWVTPIFEYVGPYNRIVLPYEKEQLVLIAMRHINSGEYVEYEQLKTIAWNFDIPVVKPIEYGDIEEVYGLTNVEGVVLAFEDGHRVKVKADWYVNIHKAKENLLHEKNVISMFFDNKIDDVLPHLMENDKLKIYNYINDLSFVFKTTRADIFYSMIAIFDKNMDRKTFALKEASKYNSFSRGIIFKLWDKFQSVIVTESNKQNIWNALMQDISDQMINIIKSKLGAQSSVEELRNWLKFKKWEY